jgi:hypothetical protein
MASLQELMGVGDKRGRLVEDALRVLDATSTRTTAMLTEPGTTNCLTLTQLEFRQCVSVTQFSYENAFCLARHGLREPSACLGSLAS